MIKLVRGCTCGCSRATSLKTKRSRQRFWFCALLTLVLILSFQCFWFVPQLRRQSQLSTDVRAHIQRRSLDGVLYFYEDETIPSPSRADIMNYRCIQEFVGLEPMSATARAFARIVHLVDDETLNIFNAHMGKHSSIVSLTKDDKRVFLAFITQKMEGTSNNSAGRIQRVLLSKKIVIPSQVHAMSGEGMGFVTGGFYSADTIIEGLAAAGINVETDVKVALDFGGSTGRASLAMSWAFPDVEWHMCDPIRRSIAWAKENIEGVLSTVSHVSPPLSYAEHQFDLIFAVSIWSHYNPPTAGLQWFKEMHRIARPGGALVVTIHGWPAIRHRLVDHATSKVVYTEMLAKGFKFISVFPNNTDWDTDTTSEDWGTSYVDLDWLRLALKGSWHVSVVLPGLADCNQDIIVLLRI